MKKKGRQNWVIIHRNKNGKNISKLAIIHSRKNHGFINIIAMTTMNNRPWKCEPQLNFFFNQSSTRSNNITPTNKMIYHETMTKG